MLNLAFEMMHRKCFEFEEEKFCLNGDPKAVAPLTSELRESSRAVEVEVGNEYTFENRHVVVKAVKTLISINGKTYNNNNNNNLNED